MTIEAEAAEDEVQPQARPMDAVEKAIAQYRKIDAKLEEIKQKHKDELAPMITHMERIEGMLKQYLEAKGWEHIKTPSGLAVLVKTKKPQVADWGAFEAWVVENNRPDMLQKRLHEKTYKDYVEDNDEPPGTSVTEVRALSIRAVKAK